MEQKPLVYAYYVDETADEMIAGNAALALVYSGEAATAMESNADLSYTVPKDDPTSGSIPGSFQRAVKIRKMLKNFSISYAVRTLP